MDLKKSKKSTSFGDYVYFSFIPMTVGLCILILYTSMYLDFPRFFFGFLAGTALVYDVIFYFRDRKQPTRRVKTTSGIFLISVIFYIFIEHYPYAFLEFIFKLFTPNFS